ncbi:MAG: hypothetical protein KAR44_08705 [Candidatus Aegiribacteria sp.]|nr:hypothetical protein [Candidatus Aegiribacteria sp.]
MIQRIHIFGASGSGTTSLAKSVANATGIPHLDTDDIFWIQTNPPFRTVRELAGRQEMLRQAVEETDSWVLSGSLCGWGNFVVPMFDLAVFLWLPTDVRMQRLQQREINRYGPEIKNPSDPRYETHKGFLEWAAAYDTGGLDMRSKATHEEWLATLSCPVVRIEHDRTIQENLKTVLNERLLNKTDTGDA